MEKGVVGVDYAELQQLLEPDLIEKFWGYCSDEEIIQLYGANLVAEAEFLNEVQLDQRIATSTYRSFLFLPESPLIEIRHAVDRIDEADETRLALLVQWHFLQRIRAGQGQEPLGDTAMDEWLSADFFRTDVETPELALAADLNPDELPNDAAQLIAQHVVANFPEISQYIALVGAKSQPLGYRELRSVGKLSAPAEVMFNTRRALVDDVGSKDWRKTEKIVANIKALVGESG